MSDLDDRERTWQDLEYDGPSDEAQRKPCPFCAEWIAADARKCRYCGEILDGAEQAPRGLWAWVKRFFRRGFRVRYEHVPVDEIRQNPFQPREYMDEHTSEFERLKQSVRAFGVIVPIIVRREKKGFVLVAGQRRLAACRALKMRSIPSLIESLTQKEMMEVAVLENLHRKELNRVESSRALQRIIYNDRMESWKSLGRRFGMDLDELKTQKGLLDLPVLLQEAVARGMITPAQAQALSQVREELALKSMLKETYQRRLSPEEIAAWTKAAPAQPEGGGHGSS